MTQDTTRAPAAQPAPATARSRCDECGQHVMRHEWYCSRHPFPESKQPSHARDSQEAERVKFEAAWREKHRMPSEVPFARFENGRYVAQAIDDAWIGYQLAAQGTQAERPAHVLEQLDQARAYIGKLEAESAPSGREHDDEV